MVHHESMRCLPQRILDESRTFSKRQRRNVYANIDTMVTLWGLKVIQGAFFLTQGRSFFSMMLLPLAVARHIFELEDQIFLSKFYENKWCCFSCFMLFSCCFHTYLRVPRQTRPMLSTNIFRGVSRNQSCDRRDLNVSFLHPIVSRYLCFSLISAYIHKIQ